METLTKQGLKINTDVLQELVSKAVKACSFIEMLPLTSLMRLQCKDNKLTLITTDDVNILKLQKEGIEGELDTVVNAKLFASLISKLTTPLTELSIEGNNLVVKANGKYDIPQIVEQDGTKVAFPEFTFDYNVNKNHISLLDLKLILSLNKACKAEMKEMPALINYYADSERVLTTDFYRSCNNPVKLFDTPVCVPPGLMELAALITNDNGVDIQANEDCVLFSSSEGVLYGRKSVREDLEAYPVNELLNCFNELYDNSCIINKSLLSNALDRICLFTEGFDSNAIDLSFEADSVTLSTKRSSSHEIIKYLQPIQFEGMKNILLDGLFLKNMLNACPKEEIVIKFGESDGIQLVCDKVVQTLSTLEEEV